MASSEDSVLLQEVQRLKATMEELKAALGSRNRVALQFLQSGPFLGQPVTITATVTDLSGGTQRVDVPLTIITTWGKLKNLDDPTGSYSNTMTARTGIDGAVRATLVPPTVEDLLDVQQDALIAMLNLLDGTASTPQEAASGLEEMGRQYRWEANADFREAVDIYFGEFRGMILNTVNARDFMLEWSHINSTVIAFAGESGDQDEAGSPVRGSGLLTLKYKNWLGPWLQTYVKLTEDDVSLGNQLKDAAQSDKDADNILSDIYDQVEDFLSKHPGRAGQYVGHQTVDNTFHGFTNSALLNLPIETQASILPVVQLTTKGTRATTLQLKNTVQIRADLKEQVNTQVTNQANAAVASAQSALNDRSAKALKDFTDQLDTAKANSIKTHQQELIGLRADSVKSHTTELTGLRADSVKSHTTELTGLRVDSVKSHTTELTGLRVDSVKSHTTELTGLRGDSIKTHTTELASLRTTSGTAHTAELTALRATSIRTHTTELTNLRSTSLATHTTELTSLRSTSLATHTTEITNLRAASVKTHTTELTGLRSASLTTHTTELVTLRTTSSNIHQNDLVGLRNASTAAHTTELSGARSQSVTLHTTELSRLRIG